MEFEMIDLVLVNIECSVEIHFCEIMDLVSAVLHSLFSPTEYILKPGPDAFTLVPESQLTVTRTAYKNNSTSMQSTDMQVEIVCSSPLLLTASHSMFECVNSR